MNIRTLALASLGLLLAAPLLAQTATDALETERAQIQADRKAIVAHLMELNEGEGAAFWPVYNDYREALRKVDDKLVTLADNYFKNVGTITDKDAEGTINQMLTLRAEKLNVRKAYVKKFSKAVPMTKVVRFYQIENKMDAVIDYELAASIPLVQ